MRVQPFLRSILSQALTVAADQKAALQARMAMARLADHVLRELDSDLTEADVTIVLETLDRILEDDRGGGITIILARALWLATPEEGDQRLFAAFHRLAARSFERGSAADSFTTIVDLLCVLGRGQSPPPDVWGEIAMRERSRFGWSRSARLITRWMTGFDSTPLWLREALLDPRVVSSLSTETLVRIIAVAPSVVLWRSHARRRQPITLPTFRRPTVAYETLEQAIVEETDDGARDRLTAWLTEVLDAFGR
jgi:hypothetical protein